MSAAYDLAALGELLEKATPGPWRRDTYELNGSADTPGMPRRLLGPGRVVVLEDVRADACAPDAVAEGCYPQDGALIVAAVNALPSMLSDLALLAEARELLDDALRALGWALDYGELDSEDNPLHAHRHVHALETRQKLAAALRSLCAPPQKEDHERSR